MIILDETQANLLRSFLVGHSKEIEKSIYNDAMCEILRTLSSQVRPDEGKVCDVILQNVDLLRCFNCGARLADLKENEGTAVQYSRREVARLGELCIDPGESNYPREPDVPAGVYFICVECSHRNREENK